MKKITFSAGQTSRRNISDLRETIIQLLISNGMGSSYVGKYVRITDEDQIELKFECANSDFTKAIGIFILLSGTQDEGNNCYYLNFRDGVIKVVVNSHKRISDIITYLEDNMNVEIQ
tara:strand:- start:11443 stop:11793 length:351 start_codon:yes stop_codon:yes gene_type:complete